MTDTWNEVLRRHLFDRKIGKGEFAREMEVERNTVSLWISGRSGVRIQHAVKLASVLGVPIQEIMGWSDPFAVELAEALARTLPPGSAGKPAAGQSGSFAARRGKPAKRARGKSDT